MITRIVAITLWVCLAAVAADPPRKLNPDLVNIRPNVWLKLHEQTRGDAVRFMRQAHGGSGFDTKRGRLILFGSNTHGRDWNNAVVTFDPVARKWTRLYRQDARAAYAVNERGIPVAGAKGEHPWAMHTFGAVMVDPARDEMIVACSPSHMVPGRFTNSVRELWPRIKRHPTWTFDLARNTWTPLPCKPVSFFPHSAALDTDRNVVLGYRPDGIYELSGKPRTWTKKTPGGPFGWHNNCAYDAKHKALVIFGTNRNSNDVVVYRDGAKKMKTMPTPGPRPPADQHNPMEFDPRIGRTVVVVDRVHTPKDATKAQLRTAKRTSEVWLYDLGKDAWQQIPTATLPFGCGMNYNLEYDPHHKVMLLVTGGYGGPTTVWALRVSLEQLQAKEGSPETP